MVVSAILWGNASRLMNSAVSEFSAGQRVLQAAAGRMGIFAAIGARRLGGDGQLTVLDVASIQIANTRRKLAPWPGASARGGPDRAGWGDFRCGVLLLFAARGAAPRQRIVSNAECG